MVTGSEKRYLARDSQTCMIGRHSFGICKIFYEKVQACAHGSRAIYLEERQCCKDLLVDLRLDVCKICTN